MILKNAKIYCDGLIQKGALLINNSIIKSIKFSNMENILEDLRKKNEDKKEIDCQNKLILPGIIDIHSHLRDMDQSEKETFQTGTKAAAFSGITTVFNMPNTIPPAISAEQVKKWLKKAENNIFVDVGFIGGIPKNFDEEEVKNIIDLGVVGFKIYPLNPLSEIDWTSDSNFQKLLNMSSKYQIPVFIHPDWPLPELRQKKEKKALDNDLEIHNTLYPVQNEAKFVKFVIKHYKRIVRERNLTFEKLPIIHFCHISCKESYILIKKMENLRQKNFKISFETTPHHLLLSNNIKLSNANFGKVLPPLRDEKHSKFLFKELTNGNIKLIATDHAPHTLEEKSKSFIEASSGIPGFETYPLLLLNKVILYELSLENFVKVASENAAKQFNLKKKGFIKENYDADLIIIDKVSEYGINPQNFKTKAKYTPFESFKTQVQIWKVLLRGIEINSEDSKPSGQIIKRLSI
ncbi:MAG TPA: dihydroorotase family protein [Candidatus Lokiarchaeia archaeon]